MPIQVRWNDSDESILILHVGKKWRWVELDEALLVVKKHLKDKVGTISLIFDMRETLQPKMNALAHYKRLLHPHPQISQIIFIGLKEGMAWMLEIYLKELSSNPLNYRVHIVATKSEAEIILGSPLTIPD